MLFLHTAYSLLACLLLVAGASAEVVFQNGPIRLTLAEESAEGLTPQRVEAGLLLAGADGVSMLLPDSADTDDEALMALVGPGPALNDFQLEEDLRMRVRAVPTGGGEERLDVVGILTQGDRTAPIGIIIDEANAIRAEHGDELVPAMLRALRSIVELIEPDPAGDTLPAD